jgi:hypothetical protein
MALLPPLRIWSINHIIAPHGITDIVHAHVHKQYPVLTAVYTGSTATGWLLHTGHNDIYLYSIFTILSIVHFRNDFVLPKWVLSTSVLLLMLQQSTIDSLLFYMLVVHVPNHYKMAWSYINKERIMTTVLLYSSGVWCDHFLWRTILAQPYFILSIMIGHILYQEYIHSNLRSANK